MFKRIDLSNYGPFQRAVLDLTGPGGKALNHAVVYGENGSGKTMLLDSVAFLKRTVLTMSSGRQLMSDRLRVQKGTVSLDSPGMDEDDICGLSTPLISLAGDGTMLSRFVLDVDGSEVDYRMCFGRTGMLEHEELHCSFGGRRALAFSITSEDGNVTCEFGRTVFGDAGVRRMLSGLADMHWGRHSMLSIIHRELVDLMAGDSGQGTEGPMHKILSWIDAVSVRTGSGQVLSGPFAVMCDGLESGRVPASEGHLLDAVESAVDDYLTGLCGSIVSVGYRRREADGWIHYRLFLERRISGRTTEVPIDRESSGVRRLLAFLPHLMGCMSGGVSVIDEMDCGIRGRPSGEAAARHHRPAHHDVPQHLLDGRCEARQDFRHQAGRRRLPSDLQGERHRRDPSQPQQPQPLHVRGVRRDSMHRAGLPRGDRQGVRVSDG